MQVAAVFEGQHFSHQSETLGSSSPIRRLRLARLRRDPEVYLLARTVARVRGMPLQQMLAAGRGSAETATARQLAMYLAHVVLGRPQEIVGALFGRHASTVSYACRVMEDLRDNPPLETEIALIESRLASDREDRDAA